MLLGWHNMTDAFATLSPAELEVLRLLAAGHTIKIIAASLGRSEGSINERLREARRKTGAASSRELARQVAALMPCPAQENCDSFIDLAAEPAEPPPADTPGAHWRRRWWIGGSVMVGGLILAGALALGAMQDATPTSGVSAEHMQNSHEIAQYLATTDTHTRDQERQFQAQLGSRDTDQTSLRISNEVRHFMRKNAVYGNVDISCGASMCRAFTKLTFSKAENDAGKKIDDLQDLFMKFGSDIYIHIADQSLSFATDAIQLNQNANGSQDILLLSYWHKK